MLLRDYLSIEESLNYVQNGIDEKSSIERSAKVIVENAIHVLQLKPVFKFKGYGVLYRTIKEEGTKNSIQLKQVFNISGYFYDSSTFYPSDFSDFTQFSSLDEPFFCSAHAVVDELFDSRYLTTHYLKNIYDEKGYHAELGRDSKIEALNFDHHEHFELSSKLPVFNDFHPTTVLAEIPNQNIFFKIIELNSIINSFSEFKNKPLKEHLKALESQQQVSATTEDEGQGDTLLILGAVMHCIKDVAKQNYTQQALIDAILIKYEKTTGISESTLKKKFPDAKKYIKQKLTS